MKDAKKGLAIAIMGAKPKGEEDSYDDDDMKESGFRDASAEAFEALKADDLKGFQTALKAAIEMC